MKVERKEQVFEPITITIESKEELRQLLKYLFLDKDTVNKETSCDYGCDIEEDLIYDLWQELDDIYYSL
jgi:hypothetical protein